MRNRRMGLRMLFYYLRRLNACVYYNNICAFVLCMFSVFSVFV